MNDTEMYTPPNLSQKVNTQTDKNFEHKLNNVSKSLKSEARFVYCPYCDKGGSTEIQRDCSSTTLILSIIGLGIFWAIAQCCRNKDLNCYNCKHYCKSCKNLLAEYKST